MTRLSIEYRRPAQMDDVITIDTDLIEARGASLVLAQRASRGEEVIAEAEITVASLSGGRPVRLPRAITQALSAATAARAN
ncbi:MAG: hypothetical protein JO310_01225 [Hyphomicrobiales bacterium]|nr:hypothetical protein [Hyphomicrobiales bacterium]